MIVNLIENFFQEIRDTLLWTLPPQQSRTLKGIRVNL